jgi:hypothetical protein
MKTYKFLVCFSLPTSPLTPPLVMSMVVPKTLAWRLQLQREGDLSFVSGMDLLCTECEGSARVLLSTAKVEEWGGV